MAEIVNIATLKIDFDQVIKKSAEYKKRIDELKQSQKELDKSTEEGRQAFAKNEVELKGLSKAYRDNQTFATSLEATNKDLNKAMSTSGKSTQELRDSRRDLNQISKQLERSEGELTGNLEYEQQLRQTLNDAIDEQTEALRGQSSEFNSSKDKIGEYEGAIKSAFQDLNIFNGGLSGMASRSAEAGGAGKLFQNGLKGMASGFLSVTKASLAFIATPVGVVLLVIVAAFLLIKNAMNRSEEATNKIKKAFAAFSGILKAVLKFLEPVGDFLIDGIVYGMELAEKAIYKTMSGIADALELLGMKDAAKSFRGFTEEIKANAQASKDLVQAELELDRANRKAQITQLEYQKRAEKLRQIRDDDTKSMPERIQANEKLGAVLKEQLTSELLIAQKALEVAKLRILADGQTKEALDGQSEALTKIAEIQERITSQESEQLTNRVSLQKEAADKAREIREKQAAEVKKKQEEAIELQKQELDLFIENQGRKAKTLQQELVDAREVSEKKKEILKAELDANKISITEYNTEILRIQNDLLQRQAEIAVDNAQRELTAYIEKNASKLDSERFLTEQLYNEEVSRLEKIAEARREYAKKEFEEGIISKTQLEDALKEIDSAVYEEKLEIQAERKEAENEQAAVDLENRLEVEALQRQSEYENLTAALEADRKAEVLAAEKTGANVALINQKYAERQKVIDSALVDSKLEGFSSVLGQFKNVLGEQTALGKTAAVAETTINTYQSATAAYKSLAGIPIVGPALGAAAAGLAVVSGLKNVQKITSTKATFAKGGILQGASHSEGGIPTPFGELEGEEAVINKRSTRLFKPLLSRINQAGGGRKFADGGILGVSNIPEVGLDIDMLASKISEANRNLPAPIVDVQEVTSRAGKVSAIEQTASF